MSVRVYYVTCDVITSGFATFPATPSGAEPSSLVAVEGRCIAGATTTDARSAPRGHCKADGSWFLVTGGCQCAAGYQPSDKLRNVCTGTQSTLTPVSACQRRWNLPSPSTSRSGGGGDSRMLRGFMLRMKKNFSRFIVFRIFLPCDAMRCTVCYRNSVRLSVRPSVTLVHCVHMVQPTITISSPYGSPIILVSGDIKFVPKFEGNHAERER